MIKVEQTKINNPEKYIYGNCFVACLACFTEIPIEEIPQFEDSMQLNRDVYKGLTWPHNALQWAFDNGWEWMSSEGHEKGLYMVCGETERNIGYHQCIYKDGELWWDPHPDKTGITKIHHFESFKKIT